ncbi:Imm51 family immunity protein [Hymenobacter cavernae]|uniref:Immunity protein 51 n=1 Tax=Hymenobacter cavernae TaxID=2044852 RepID=A0ABQ1U1S5_9BACT|nr:Imm51 family immunity protein [Hymenobacter cavernae]GGF07453.1 hypothetical protein GCM10011383_18140 [Hymenobacter cavernae]
MTNTYPFVLTHMGEHATPERQYAVLANVAGLDDYYTLFEKYGFGGDGTSWAEHIETIVEEHKPELLDHLELAATRDRFLVYADSQAAAEQLLALIHPIFSDLSALRNYLAQTDPGDFFE